MPVYGLGPRAFWAERMLWRRRAAATSKRRCAGSGESMHYAIRIMCVGRGGIWNRPIAVEYIQSVNHSLTESNLGSLLFSASRAERLVG